MKEILYNCYINVEILNERINIEYVLVFLKLFMDYLLLKRHTPDYLRIHSFNNSQGVNVACRRFVDIEH